MNDVCSHLRHNDGHGNKVQLVKSVILQPLRGDNRTETTLQELVKQYSYKWDQAM